jgi:hypothetical protein
MAFYCFQYKECLCNTLKNASTWHIRLVGAKSENGSATTLQTFAPSFWKYRWNVRVWNLNLFIRKKPKPRLRMTHAQCGPFQGELNSSYTWVCLQICYRLNIHFIKSSRCIFTDISTSTHSHNSHNQKTVHILHILGLLWSFHCNENVKCVDRCHGFNLYPVSDRPFQH